MIYIYIYICEYILLYSFDLKFINVLFLIINPILRQMKNIIILCFLYLSQNESVTTHK